MRVSHPFTIDGWVLLPDHLHCIWTLPNGDTDFSKRWAMIKRYVTKRIQDSYHRTDWMTTSKLKRKESTIWQGCFWEHQIRDVQDLSQHLDYLHYNPVKHGYANRVCNWPHSTFHRFVLDGLYPLDWGDLILGPFNLE